MPLLVSGYKLHGKDRFYHKCLQGWDHVKQEYHIYYRSPIQLQMLIDMINSQIERMAFADELKRIVGEALGLSIQDIERLKDQPIRAGDPTTYRDVLKRVAIEKRDKDVDYFAKKVLEFGCKNNTVITDFRYPNEYPVIFNSWPNQTLTLRVYYSQARIPDSDDQSEHKLDKFDFDFYISDIELDLPGYHKV